MKNFDSKPYMLNNIFIRAILTEKITSKDKQVECFFNELNNRILFEFNNISTREYVESMLSVGLRFLDKFVCDETNNTPETLDRGVLFATIFYDGKIVILKFGFNNYEKGEVITTYEKYKF